MERSVAVRKLGKILGKNVSWRVNPKAPDKEGREAARAKMAELLPRREALNQALAERRRIVLEADQEYQRVGREYREIRKRCDELHSVCLSYRFTVGTCSNMFFLIKAQGDSWEQIIDKLTTVAHMG